MRKLCTILVALALVVLCIVLLPTEARAASESDLTFTVNADGESYSVSDCDESASGSLTIPATYNGKPVTSIGYRAFLYCDSLINITIPDSVTSIGHSAFSGCTRLMTVTMSNSITSIDDYAFNGCTILSNISIPDSITRVSKSVFQGCTYLSYNTYDNAKYLGNAKNPYLVLMEVPEEWNDEEYAIHPNTRVIGGGAFYGCDLTSITIPDSVTVLCDGAFSCCYGLTSVIIPDSVTCIGGSVFSDCYSLTSVTVPDSVTSIGSDAFYACSKLSYNTYGNAKYLGNSSNPYVVLIGATSTSIKNVDVHPSTKLIFHTAFRNCTSLTSITIPDSVTNIGEYAFFRCLNLNAIWVDADNMVYSSDSYGVLFNKNQTQLIQAPTRISGSYTIPDNVIFVEDNAFYQCAGLSNLTIGNSVTSIGLQAFYRCSALTSVTIGDSVTSIGDSAFSNCTSLTSISIPDSVTVLGDSAFLGCTSLISISIPDSVTVLGDSAFWGCSSLKSVTIGNGVTSIPRQSFGFCESLDGTTIPDSVTEICVDAFYDCTSLTSMAIPDSVISIRYGAFEGCTSMNSVIYCGTEEQWGQITIDDENELLTNATRSYHAYSGFSDSSCNVCGEIRELDVIADSNLKFMSTPSLSFQDYIGMQVLMTKKLAGNYDKVYVEAVQVTPEGEVTTILNPITYLTNYYVFDQQIMAWSMTEVVTLTLYAEKDGVTYVGETYTQSVESLALAMLEKYSTNTTVCQMLVDMLNYGAAVQTQFSHNAENLPNTQLGDFAAMGSTNIPECDAANTKTGTATVKVINDSVSMQAKVEIQLVIKGAVTATPKATIGETVLNPVLDTTSIKGYTVIRVAIAATQMRETVTIALYDENDAPVTQVYNVSVEGYAVTAITGSQKNVVIAMMRYGDSVTAYANK